MKYYVNDNAQDDGSHEVHRHGCEWLSKVVSKTYLGEFTTCQPAVREAKRKYPKSDGCYYCSQPCHTR